MQLRKPLRRPLTVFATLFALTLFINPSHAQGNLPTLTGTGTDTTPARSSAQASTIPASAGSSAVNTQSASTPSNTASTPDTVSATVSSESTLALPSNTNKKTTITPTGPPSSDTISEAAPPALTSSALPSLDGAAPSGLPKLSGVFSYPPPSVPPTLNAPYMQKSNLPEGTVFIAVGACLGALGFVVLAWRGLVAWSLHRSVKRAALYQSATDSKSAFRPGPGATADGPGFYQAHAGSTMSLDALSGTNRNSLAGGRHTPNGSLFFSPTASGNMTTPGNRGSGHLPAGYYQSGASTPGNGNGVTHIGGSTTNPLARVGPQSHGYTRPPSGYVSRPPSGYASSPPISPNLTPQRGPVGGNHTSTSGLNLTQAPQGRTPSVYLEDLFEGRG
jgi:hypothetical protein